MCQRNAMRLSEDLPWISVFDKRYTPYSHTVAWQPLIPDQCPFVLISSGLLSKISGPFRALRRRSDLRSPSRPGAGLGPPSSRSATEASSSEKANEVSAQRSSARLLARCDILIPRICSVDHLAGKTHLKSWEVFRRQPSHGPSWRRWSPSRKLSNDSRLTHGHRRPHERLEYYGSMVCCV